MRVETKTEPEHIFFCEINLAAWQRSLRVREVVFIRKHVFNWDTEKGVVGALNIIRLIC